MAIAATAVWRVRPSGNNLNGGGFDPAVSGTLSTTLNGAITAAATTIVVASATGWPTSGNYYARIGVGVGVAGASEVVQVTGGQGTTSWTVTRGVLGTTAAAQASGIPVDNELSCCNTAIATGTAGTSNASTTFSDAGLATNLTMVGNTLWLASGTNGTVGVYVIQSIASPTSVVLDRNCSTAAMANGAWKIGGAWADFWTNTTANIVAGNTVYILGGGSPSYGSPDYAPSTYFTPVSGSSTAGNVGFVGDPTTPATNGFRGYPLISSPGGLLFYTGVELFWKNLWIFAVSAANGSFGSLNSQGYAVDCVFDQNGYDITIVNIRSMYGCEVYSSIAKRSTNILNAVSTNQYGGEIKECNIHNCIGPGINLSSFAKVVNSIIAKNGGTGISVSGSAGQLQGISNCTIDANTGSGINFATQVALQVTMCLNNIISNHTTGGTYGITVGAGTLAQNNRVKCMIDYNMFYNNTTNYNAVGAGAHDVTGGANPFVDQPNGDYTLTSTYIATGYPQAKFPGY